MVDVVKSVVESSTALAETDLRALKFGAAELGVDKVVGALSVRGRPRPREREGPTASVGGMSACAKTSKRTTTLSCGELGGWLSSPADFCPILLFASDIHFFSRG